MMGIALLQGLYRLFPGTKGPLTLFSKVTEQLRKKLGATQAVFALRQEDGLRTPQGNRAFEGAVEKALLARWKRHPAPWIRGPKEDPKWLGFWPVVLGGDWTGCYALGRKLDRQGLSTEEDLLMRLLADRSACYLEQRRFWESLEMSEGRSALGFGSAAMIHEIRGPLTALSALAQLLPEKKDDPSFMDPFQKVMMREIDRLSGMTETFLSRAKPGKNGSGPFDLSKILRQTLFLLGPLFTAKRVRLETRIPLGLLLTGEERQVESLVMNLLQNALEAVGPSGKVEVSAVSLARKGLGPGPWIGLKIRNNGKGILRGDLGNIFRPYFSTKPKGIGLGLTLCQRVVENHRGTIKVSSSQKGTLFQVFLPKTRKI